MGWREKMGVKDDSLNLISHPYNPQYPQNPPEKDKNDNFTNFTDITPKNENIKTIQQQYDDLWQKAWTLADRINDQQSGVDVEIRCRMLPELNRLRDELVKLEQAGAQPPGSNNEQVKQHEIPKVQEENPDTCPARCKQTDRCYGRAYFLGKPGGSQDCSEPCPYSQNRSL